MRAAQQFAAELVVGMRPGEGFEHLGLGRPGGEDPGDHPVVEMAEDRDDLGCGGGSRDDVHRHPSAVPAGNFPTPGAPLCSGAGRDTAHRDASTLRTSITPATLAGEAILTP